jgi:hypothetical protein
VRGSVAVAVADGVAVAVWQCVGWIGRGSAVILSGDKSEKGVILGVAGGCFGV